MCEASPQPVETLLDYYITGQHATKERLYEALVAINRLDVANIVWHTL